MVSSRYRPGAPPGTGFAPEALADSADGQFFDVRHSEPALAVWLPNLVSSARRSQSHEPGRERRDPPLRRGSESIASRSHASTRGYARASPRCRCRVIIAATRLSPQGARRTRDVRHEHGRDSHDGAVRRGPASRLGPVRPTPRLPLNCCTVSPMPTIRPTARCLARRPGSWAFDRSSSVQIASSMSSVGGPAWRPRSRPFTVVDLAVRRLALVRCVPRRCCPGYDVGEAVEHALDARPSRRRSSIGRRTQSPSAARITPRQIRSVANDLASGDSLVIAHLRSSARRWTRSLSPDSNRGQRTLRRIARRTAGGPPSPLVLGQSRREDLAHLPADRVDLGRTRERPRPMPRQDPQIE